MTKTTHKGEWNICHVVKTHFKTKLIIMFDDKNYT